MLNTAEIDCLIADLEQYTAVNGAFKSFQGQLKFSGQHCLQEKPELFKSHHEDGLGISVEKIVKSNAIFYRFKLQTQ